VSAFTSLPASLTGGVTRVDIAMQGSSGKVVAERGGGHRARPYRKPTAATAPTSQRGLEQW